MEEEILKKGKLNQKIDKIWRSVEKIRKYFLWTLIITLVLFFLPLVGLLFIIPKFLSIYTSALNFFSFRQV